MVYTIQTDQAGLHSTGQRELRVSDHSPGQDRRLWCIRELVLPPQSRDLQDENRRKAAGPALEQVLGCNFEPGPDPDESGVHHLADKGPKRQTQLCRQPTGRAARGSQNQELRRKG